MDQEDFLEEPEVIDVEEVLDPNNPEDAFKIVSRSYNKLVEELEEQQNDANQLDEIEKMFEYLCTMREQAVAKSTEIDEMTKDLSAKKDTLHKTQTENASQRDQIEQLESDVEISHQRLDTAHAREQICAEIIDNLRKNVIELRSEIEYKDKIAEAPLLLHPSIKHASLEQENSALTKKFAKLTAKLENAITYQERLEQEKVSSEEKIEDLKDQVEAESMASAKQKRGNEILQQKLKGLIETIDQSEDKVTKLQKQVREEQKKLWNTQESLANQRELTNKRNKQLSMAQKQIKENQMQKSRLNGKVRMQELRNVTLVEEKLTECQRRKELEKTMQKYQNAVETANRESSRKKDENQQLINKFSLMQDRLKFLDGELAKKNQKRVCDKRTIDQCKREFLHSKQLLRQQETRTKVKESSLHMQKEMRNSLERSLKNYMREVKKKATEAEKLHAERVRLIDNADQMRTEIKDALHERDVQAKQVQHMNKALSHSAKQLRRQEESLIATRMQVHKQDRLIGKEKDVNIELREKLVMKGLENEQLKHQIDCNEAEIIRKDVVLRKIADERDHIRLQYQEVFQNVAELKQRINSLLVVEKRMQNAITESDKATSSQRLVMEGLKTEREVISTQLVRRNQQVRLMCEKIELLEGTLRRGHTEYSQRLDDIALLKVEVKRLRQAEMQLTKSLQLLNQLKMEVFHLERDLTRERVKCKALESEMQNPLNMHRWRKLQGSDPDRFFLLRKTNFLQRRLSQQSSLLVKREMQLTVFEGLCETLKNTIDSKLSPSMKYSAQARKRLSDANNRTKTMTIELQMLEIEKKRNFINMMASRKELCAVRKRLTVERKKRWQQTQIIRAYEAKAKVVEASTVRMKCAGGGFRMAVCVSSLKN